MDKRIKPYRPPAARPLLGSLREVSGKKAPGRGIKLEDHESLLRHAGRIQKAFQDHPEIGSLLLVNPAYALEDLGFEVAPAVRQHITRSLRHGAAAREEMAALDKEIREALGPEGASLNFAIPEHAATILFDLLKLAPLATQGVEPPYRPIAQSDRLKALEAAATKPSHQVRFPPGRRPHGMTLTFPTYVRQTRNLDLDAPIPALPPAPSRPAAVTTEELVFYRDAHPLVKKLARYQVLHHSAIPFTSRDTYNQIRDGQLGNAWASWIKAATFKRGDE